MSNGKKDINFGVAPNAGGEVSLSITEIKGERQRSIQFDITSEQARGLGVLLIENAFMADRAVPAEIPPAAEPET